MKTLAPLTAARAAVSASAARPATAVLLNTPDVRLVVFRLAPGQSVAPHQNASTVMLTVLAGEGVLSGADGDRQCATGDLVVYDPSEMHSMRAVDHELLLLATIAPRPGDRAADITPGAGGA
jgi:quercetin dioxygenase-like cupin family protein